MGCVFLLITTVGLWNSVFWLLCPAGSKHFIVPSYCRSGEIVHIVVTDSHSLRCFWKFSIPVIVWKHIQLDGHRNCMNSQLSSWVDKDGSSDSKLHGCPFLHGNFFVAMRSRSCPAFLLSL